LGGGDQEDLGWRTAGVKVLETPSQPTSWVSWYAPVILAVQEAIGRIDICVWSQQNHEPLPEKQTKTKWTDAVWFKWWSNSFESVKP
jgi:hypothetical protein